ncbi:MAG: HIT family hydrolase, partial [Candidatus Omnitrophica bacterium CG12_big_fil_rev_8_21_14_0_65_50_5]
VVRGEYCFIVMNLYPYNNGHLLVIPNRHVNDLKNLKLAEKREFFDMLEYAKDLLTDILSPEGFNIGMNLGRAAGAGIPRHLHMHIVPRWLGDMNFMLSVADTKVMSQSLKELHKQLSDAHTTRLRRI